MIQISLTSKRPAFSMLTAIFLMVLMASVAAFVMNLSGKMVQETTTQYKKEQAILFAKSYTEFAIMAATAQNCIQTITADIEPIANGALIGNGYHVEVHAQYIGNGLNAQPNCDTIGAVINTPSSQGAILLLDTYVHYRDPAHPNSVVGVTWANNRGIVYHRRTLQRL